MGIVIRFSLIFILVSVSSQSDGLTHLGTATEHMVILFQYMYTLDILLSVESKIILFSPARALIQSII